MVDVKSKETEEAIFNALQKNFIFNGISGELLREVVSRMFGVCFHKGGTILQQGANPAPNDCMYFLENGEVDVVISGSVESAQRTNEASQVAGNLILVHKYPGWIFGDVALLFNSPRSASVVAATDIVLWALDRPTFLRFVMKHAQGARALRFVRKLPILKGLSDNVLLSVASRLKEEVYEDAQPLIRYGQPGHELFLIRYGKVRVLRPDEEKGRVEVAVLGRG